MKVLVLGATGMLGNAVFRLLGADPTLSVSGSARSEAARQQFALPLRERLVCGVDLDHPDSLARVFGAVAPDVVINCVGLVKQLADANDPLQAIPINALLPHRLAALCRIGGARLIQIGTDCVFSGSRGRYQETDGPDAQDLYGRSKLLGETDYPYALTLRTSIIGHELRGHRSLVNWFLAQEGQVRGFTRAIFSGLPTVVLAELIRDQILPRPGLCGLFHVAAAPISKYDLLRLVAAAYGKQIEIIADDTLVIDRSLDAARFAAATGYVAPSWDRMIARMAQFR